MKHILLCGKFLQNQTFINLQTSFSGNVNFIDKRVYSYIANPYNRLFCPTDLYPFFKT